MRDAPAVFARLMALRALLWRTQFEMHLAQQGAPRSEIESRNAELRTWMRAATIPFSPNETALLDRPLGSWSHEDSATLVWRNEAAAALLWTLDLVPSLPPFSIVVPAAAIMERIEQLPQLAEPPPLRPAAELERALEVAGLWNWRARTEGMRLAGTQPPAGDTYEATIARACDAALAAKLVDDKGVAGGDLAIAPGTPYRSAPTEVLRQLACIAHERHWALTWVHDASTAWDSVNPST